MKTPLAGRDSASGKGRSRATRAANDLPPRQPEQRRRPRGLLIAGIIVLCVLAAGGTFLGITLKKAADAGRVASSLKQASYYEGKGEYEEALKILNGLDIDDPRVKQLLDDVLAKKKAADEAARQQELSALLAQQEQLRAGLNELGEKLKNQPQKIVIQPPPEKTAAENATTAEKERQKKVQDLLQKGRRGLQRGPVRARPARISSRQPLWTRETPTPSPMPAFPIFARIPRIPTNVQKAVDLSNKAIDKNPDNWLPHRTLGEIYDSRKLADDAMREYKMAARLNPDDADTLFALGKLQYRAKLFADALKSFDGCVRAAPGFHVSPFQQGHEPRSARPGRTGHRRVQIGAGNEERFR